jgi:hypothetical protein
MTPFTIALTTILLCIVVIAYLSIKITRNLYKIEEEIGQAIWALNQKMLKNTGSIHRLEFMIEPKAKIEKPKAKRGRPRKNAPTPKVVHPLGK